ncbi:MAG: alpha/beta fold hydrolase [Bacteroidota bacterium]
MNLNFKELGQGPPLVVLHGLFGMLDNWQTLAKRFAQHHTVYLVDQRNHGRSPHASPMDYPTMAEDLHDFLVDKWIHHAHILGHSMGGKTAMEFALQYPDMVDQLIVVDIAPKAYQGGHQVIFDALLALDLSQVKSRSDASTFLESRIEEVGVRQFLLKNLSRAKEGGYRWKMNLPVIHEHYPSILATIEPDRTFEGETLFIRGGQSNYVQANDFPTISSFFPKAQVVTVEQAGHWVHAEAPEALLQHVSTFLGW